MKESNDGSSKINQVKFGFQVEVYRNPCPHLGKKKENEKFSKSFCIELRKTCREKQLITDKVSLF